MLPTGSMPLGNVGSNTHGNQHLNIFYMQMYPYLIPRQILKLRFTNFTCHNIQIFVYSYPMNDPKPLEFRDRALDELRGFPISARRDAGHQLDLVQRGYDPVDWKPMKTVGAGAREIRIADEGDAFRVMYVAKFEDAVYVLHCFKKTSQKTSKTNLSLATKRYQELV
ncbi:MAG: hypothetical protein JWM78_1451 [Verrucomicrobiaceae bacterium]|nr:hypothetical protein [Verrucomicrobiaceae bacterium]